MSSHIKDALKMAALAIDGLEVIQGFTKIGGAGAAGALLAIDKIVGALRDGFDGKTTPDIVSHELNALRDQLASNDATADTLLDKKFKPEV